jgi:hypothetical protein
MAMAICPATVSANAMSSGENSLMSRVWMVSTPTSLFVASFARKRMIGTER